MIHNGPLVAFITFSSLNGSTNIRITMHLRLGQFKLSNVYLVQPKRNKAKILVCKIKSRTGLG